MARAANTSKATTKLNADIEEVKGLYHKVCRELDALSHFHYTPKPVVVESVITGLPSIEMEEVIPLTESNVSTKAPEEVECRVILNHHVSCHL